MKTERNGLSLVEILVAIGIVAVLAALAVPAYQNYMLNTTLSEAFSLLDEERIKIELYYDTHSVMPNSGSDAGIIEYPDFGLVTQLQWRSGIPGDPSADTAHVGTFRPIMDLTSFGDQYGQYSSTFFFVGTGDQSGRIRWECIIDTRFDHNRLDQELLPASCHPR